MKFILLISLLLLTACTTTKPIQVTSGCPRITIPPEPRYPAQDLKHGDGAAKVNKALVATIAMQHDYIHGQLIPLLRPFE